MLESSDDVVCSLLVCVEFCCALPVLFLEQTGFLEKSDKISHSAVACNFINL